MAQQQQQQHLQQQQQQQECSQQLQLQHNGLPDLLEPSWMLLLDWLLVPNDSKVLAAECVLPLLPLLLLLLLFHCRMWRIRPLLA
jgi:hypothetical protein